MVYLLGMSGWYVCVCVLMLFRRKMNELSECFQVSFIYFVIVPNRNQYMTISIRGSIEYTAQHNTFCNKNHFIIILSNNCVFVLIIKEEGLMPSFYIFSLLLLPFLLLWAKCTYWHLNGMRQYAQQNNRKPYMYNHTACNDVLFLIQIYDIVKDIVWNYLLFVGLGPTGREKLFFTQCMWFGECSKINSIQFHHLFCHLPAQIFTGKREFYPEKYGKHEKQLIEFKLTYFTERQYFHSRRKWKWKW